MVVNKGSVSMVCNVLMHISTLLSCFSRKMILIMLIQLSVSSLLIVCSASISSVSGVLKIHVNNFASIHIWNLVLHEYFLFFVLSCKCYITMKCLPSFGWNSMDEAGFVCVTNYATVAAASNFFSLVNWKLVLEILFSLLNFLLKFESLSIFWLG